jgi:hypothetical protein
MIAALDFSERLPFDAIQVPPVRLERDCLHFRPQGPLRVATGRRERLVFDFANLADASKDAFLEFARRWGVLGLCEHKRPVFHQVPPCLPRRAGSEFVEPIAYWRNRARHIRAILNVKGSLKRDKLGARCDWKTIWPGKPPADRTDAANALAIVTSILLSQVNVQPALLYLDNRLTIKFVGGNFFDLLNAMSANEDLKSWLSTSGTLLAEIAVGTALALQEGTGWTLCSTPECRRLYRPKRHTPEGRLHFCPDCGKRAAWRLSKRRQAAKRKKESSRSDRSK